MSFRVHREPRRQGLILSKGTEMIGKKRLEVLLNENGVPQKEKMQAVIDHDHLMGKLFRHS
jgi:hypothetical protein